MTTSVMIGERERILEEGFNGFITKPINFAELLGAVEAALTKSG